MTKQDRTTLKSYFTDGALPTAKEYRDLIDSSVNQIEDGFDKTRVDGLRLESIGASPRLMSLYRGLEGDAAAWVVDHGKVKGTLHFRPGAPVVPPLKDVEAAEKAAEKAADTDARADTEAADATQPAPQTDPPAKAPTDPPRRRFSLFNLFRTLFRKAPPQTPAGDDAGDMKPASDALGRGMSLTSDGCLGVNVDVPQWRLDVDGVARMAGRRGLPTPGIPSIPADNEWHDITREITGCQAFEVMAGVGGSRRKGRYSMLHAIAMNAYNPSNPLRDFLFGPSGIRQQTAVYGKRADRLKLKWVDGSTRHHFRLQMRCCSRIEHDGEPVQVFYQLTSLWQDSLMAASRGERDRDEGLL